jgi:hypothetical protein
VIPVDINTQSEWRLQPAGLPVPRKLRGQQLSNNFKSIGLLTKCWFPQPGGFPSAVSPADRNQFALNFSTRFVTVRALPHAASNNSMYYFGSQLVQGVILITSQQF